MVIVLPPPQGRSFKVGEIAMERMVSLNLFVGRCVLPRLDRCRDRHLKVCMTCTSVLCGLVLWLGIE